MPSRREEPTADGRSSADLPGSASSPRPSFPQAARAALNEAQLRANLRFATGAIRAKRAGVVGEVSDWQPLREAARRIKTDVMADLDRYLDQLEASVSSAGGIVHRAADAREANAIVADLVEGTGVGSVVKVKSITTDEIGLNESLARRGIDAVETDLAELIIQLAGERSSHFLVPAIHKNRTQIRDLFRVHLGRPDLSDDPRELAEAARIHLREHFLEAEVAISGANFAVAETGTVGVVESEGNGRMCLTLPETLITVMGIEKVLPSFADLSVFLQLLPRSATGERMNPYTTLWTGVHPGDGPRTFHLVLLDNGRRRVLADPVGRQALHCIRCSACLNICPVYARVGGHAYHATYPGPIGSILTPQLLGPGVHDSLPFASTLCGACRDVCPVAIDIPEVLLHLRARAVDGSAPPASAQGALAHEAPRREHSGQDGPSWEPSAPVAPNRKPPAKERVLMGLLGWVFRSPTRYRWALRIGRRLPWPGRGDGWVNRLPGYGAGWTAGRDMRDLAGESFKEWWARRQKAGNGSKGSADIGPSPEPGIEAVQVEHSAHRDKDEASGQSETSRSDEIDVLQRLVHRLEDYGATVTRCPGPELPSVVAERLAALPEGDVVLPDRLPGEWMGEAGGAGRDLVRDRNGSLPKSRLGGAVGVVSGCTLAIAETGTLVLAGGDAEGRRALTLLPDYHLCILGADQVVASVPEAVAAMGDLLTKGVEPLTLVSGPSATSDIELVRVEGVHGPRTLDVILIDSNEEVPA